MEIVSDEKLRRRIRTENPWWDTGHIDAYARKLRPRAYLSQLFNLLVWPNVRRAVVLMGPRRVGKTILIQHTIEKLMEHRRVAPNRICYISIESPVYAGKSLEDLVHSYLASAGIRNPENCFIFLDEIQYLKGWEIHLKRLVDDYRNTKFIATGSSAAALRLKSTESGAGRFTDLPLPPLSFFEYLDLLGRQSLVKPSDDALEPRSPFGRAASIETLNKEFFDYINFGGYPEALFSESIQADPQRFIRSDIIEKVLLRDLPTMYGIQDVQELNRFFTSLALNSGNEVSLDALARSSGVAKNTVKKYLEYLQAAFLITILHRVDESGRKFRRANYFKAYLTNSSMRCALSEPIGSNDPFAGNMVETAILSQWAHSPALPTLHYARFDKGGEVDLVRAPLGRIEWCVEIKWSDRFFQRPADLKNLLQLAKAHQLESVVSTTQTARGAKTIDGITIEFVESALYCHAAGRNAVKLQSVLTREKQKRARLSKGG